ncbi:rRNA small subunit pseudouridine methyltransferase Nep1 [Nematocida displodere]|uniref:rRNA small subunit pseudouridine methyltransferase Nep1 n=1 Tax=Nematocida displodere TaxID=1805483 RepID=A0A177ED66_9MICR|nr:rRNA small subunit pseudouridine methyltransferase Nep1 [Nematocida displodere]OAG32264.1 rRNA small subunit pseudouridine methyltransferase Nep1 [Nematocida displodere]
MLTVVLQNALLEVAKTNKGKVLLSSETPEARKAAVPGAYRPDILHQCLLTLLDSPLNKAGSLKILIVTTANAVIEINPQTRIPRVFTRFAGLMIQLLERNRIYASSTRDILMQLHKGAVEGYIPKDAQRIGLSQEGESLYNYIAHANTATLKESVDKMVFFINVVSSGEDVFKDATLLSLSSFALSAATCCSKVCCEVEKILGIF